MTTAIEEYENEIIRLTKVLDTITNFEDIEDMEESAASAGLSYVEYLEMAYENIKGAALSAIMEEREPIDPAAEDNPAAQALDDLWKAIILKNKPDYGDWEYPGQAYRHLLAEYEELKAASDWQYIDLVDAGTLPPYSEKIITTSKDGAVEGGHRKRVMYGVREIDIILHENGDWTNLEDCVAWQPWPDPAPLPGGVNE